MLHFYIKRNHHQYDRIIFSLDLRRLFSTKSSLNNNEIHTWSHLLRGLLYHGKPKEVLQQYFNKRPQLHDLSVQTYCILFKACISAKKWSQGHQFYIQIQNNKNIYDDQRLKIASRF